MLVNEKTVQRVLRELKVISMQLSPGPGAKTVDDSIELIEYLRLRVKNSERHAS